MAVVDLRELTTRIRSGMAKQITNGATLAELANDSEWVVRAAVATNSHIFPDTLEKLSHDPEWIVRRNIANNPSTSRAIRLRLTHDENEKVREAAKRIM